jgi:hypothetical protein
MWVKRTEAEIAAGKRRERLTDFAALLGLSALCGAGATFCFSGFEPALPGQLFAPRSQWVSRIPFGIFFGGGALFFLLRSPRKPPAMICPKCETTKHDDGNRECPCGGHFEETTAMKYVP